MRGYAIAPDFALLLATLVADEKPRLVVETGSGVSTLVIAYALEQLGSGHVIALDHDPTFASKTRAEIDRHGLNAFATVVHAPLEPIDVDGERHLWYAVSAIDQHAPGEIDLVVDDGPPKYVGPRLRYASLPVFARRLSAQGIFVLDYVGDEERVMLERWRQRYPDFSQEHLDTKKGNVILRRARP
jgi:predicted O-methyltransferase YrrM